jgi:hypothetical protein
VQYKFYDAIDFNESNLFQIQTSDICGDVCFLSRISLNGGQGKKMNEVGKHPGAIFVMYFPKQIEAKSTAMLFCLSH